MNEKIYKYIIEEAEPYYNKKNLQEVVNCFIDILDYPVDEPDLMGVGKRINSALESLVNEKQDKDSLCILLPAICKVEAYARKVLFLTEKEVYNGIVKDQKGFAAVLKPLNINFSGGPMGNVYELRNLESHSCKDWTTRQYYDKITDSIVAYLIITNSRLSQLKHVVYKETSGSENSKNIIENYVNQIITKFQSKVKQTIQLTSEENIEVGDIYAEEQVEKGKGRRGTVKELMSLVNEKRMIIWGDAGAGKTTTLEYLAYRDAKDYVEKNGKIPVLIYLGSATNEHYTLTEYIQHKIGVDYEMVTSLLKNGKLNLYLDGFNEIPLTEMNMLKTKRRRELAEILSEYKKTFIVLTNRPQDGKEFSDIPVFNLLKMDDKQIDELLKCSIDNSGVMNLVKKAIENDQNLKNLVKTPLILKSLIFIAETTGKIPTREGQIIGMFLKALFTREKQEKYDEYLDERKMNYLLRRIGYETLESNQTNSGVSEECIIDIMTKCQRDYSFSYDSMYALRLMVHLGILEKRDDTYVFAHQSYQDYYHSQELAAVMGI